MKHFIALYLMILAIFSVQTSAYPVNSVLPSFQPDRYRLIGNGAQSYMPDRYRAPGNGYVGGGGFANTYMMMPGQPMLANPGLAGPMRPMFPGQAWMPGQQGPMMPQPPIGGGNLPPMYAANFGMPQMIGGQGFPMQMMNQGAMGYPGGAQMPFGQSLAMAPQLQMPQFGQWPQNPMMNMASTPMAWNPSTFMPGGSGSYYRPTTRERDTRYGSSSDDESRYSSRTRDCDGCRGLRNDINQPLFLPPDSAPPIAQAPRDTEAGASALPRRTDRIAQVDDQDDGRPRPALRPSADEEVVTRGPTPATPSTPPPPRPGARPAPRPEAAGSKPIVKVVAPSTEQRSRDRLTPREGKEVESLNGALASAKKSPAWDPMVKALNQCAPGCVPAQASSYRPASGGVATSCHNSNRAVDLLAIKCDGRTIWPLLNKKTGEENPQFTKIAKCMKAIADNAQGQHAIWQNKAKSTANLTSGHYDHIHYSVGCKVNGQGYW